MGMKKKQDNLRDDFPIVKGNLLNEAKLDGKITLVEYRLILIALSKISPLSKSMTVFFEVSDFCKLLGLVTDGMYNHIKKSSENLASRTLKIENKKAKKWEILPWLRNIKYNVASISITFNPDLKEHILEIKKKGGYTKYFVKNILNLDSIYSVRLYELLKQYEVAKQRKISVIDLREKIGAIKKTYERMCDFRRELNKAKNRINICTDLVFDYEEIKEGRKTKEIVFHIKSKKCISIDYEISRKDKLILLIQKKIYNKTGHIFDAKHMNRIHRNILLELLQKLDNCYENIFIKTPEGFFINEIKIIQEKYDMELLNKKFEDY